MPRPRTRDDLMAAIELSITALDETLDGLTPEQAAAAGTPDDWSPKDIVAHVDAWAAMFLGWWEAGERGDRPAVPAPGFKWSETPALNAQIFEANRTQPLAGARRGLETRLARIREVIDATPPDVLFVRGHVGWTGTSSLGSYLVSATSSHLEWARREIRAWLKAHP
ncbi:MAG: ClbS/DfsB family four-helix bundle protein [Dehalococcoidia bacterium]